MAMSHWASQLSELGTVNVLQLQITYKLSMSSSYFASQL